MGSSEIPVVDCQVGHRSNMTGAITNCYAYRQRRLSFGRHYQAPNRMSQLVVFAAFTITTTGVTSMPSSSSSSVIIEGDYRKFYITEERPANSFVCNLVTELGLNSKYDSEVVDRMRFSFLTLPSFDRPYFSVDERTGIIRTTRRIDRERICPSAGGSAAGRSGVGQSSTGGSQSVNTGDPGHCLAQFDVAIKPMEFFQIVKIAVEIIDENDHAPEFPTGQIHHRIAESADPESGGIVIPTAVDPDAGRYGVRKYELLSATDKFLLDTRETADGGTDLRLLLREPLDRETEDRYEVIVVASDGGDPAKSGSTILNITVLDVNDNAPVFQNDTYEVHVFENVSGGKVIARVQARDADLDSNGAITYSFTPQTEQRHGRLFGIRPDSGKIYVKSDPGLTVDRETAVVHLLSVTATDHGPDPLSAHATVVVHVDDVNDNAPSINVNTLTIDGLAEVVENAAPGTFVAYASVQDADTGENGRFRCGVMTSSGQVGGVDSSPFALRQQSFAPTEYQLVTTSTFDREQRDRYDITVTCSDHGDPSLTSSALVRVRVRDENDHPPRFSREIYEFEIDENCAIGTAVGRVVATDADDGPNGEIEYRLQGLPDAARSSVLVGKLLRINARTGHIFTRDDLDREKLMVFPDEPVQFLAVAIDRGSGGSSMTSSGQTATATVKLYINDVNDQSPHFDRDHYEFYVLENHPAGTFVGQVIAEDLDLPPNNHLRYSIVAGTKDVGMTTPNQFVFDVDPETGNVTTREILDRERKTDYVFDVVARGHVDSFPTYSATAHVTVHVTDLNDHRPLFTNPLWNNQTLGVSSMAPVGYVVARLRAVDLDAGPNANLTYRIVAGNRRETFTLNPVTGALSVATELGAITFEDFDLRVAVHDAGTPSLGDQAELRLVVSRDIVHPTPVTISGSDLTRFYGGVLASENTAIVLAATLAAILTAVAAIAVTICVIRWRGHSRRVFRCSIAAPVDNGCQKSSTGMTSVADGKTVSPSAVWGSPGFNGGTVDIARSNGRVRPVDYAGSVNGQLQHACVRLHQTVQDGAIDNGRAITTSLPPFDTMATSAAVATDLDTLYGSKQFSYDGDKTTESVVSTDHRMTSSCHSNSGRESPSVTPSISARRSSISSDGPSAAQFKAGPEAGRTIAGCHRFGLKHEMEHVNPVNKPVVVFVKDQLQHDYERFSPGSSSNTDSGRGNSDYGEELSPPMATPALHDASVTELGRHPPEPSLRRMLSTPSPSSVSEMSKLSVGPPRTGSRSNMFHNSSAAVPMPLSGTLSVTRRTGTGYQPDRYHTLATFVPTHRKLSADTDTAASMPSAATGYGNFTSSPLPAQHFEYANRLGDSSSLAAAMVGGSPKRYPTCVNPSGGRIQHHQRHQHRGRVKMTETVSDLNLARHLVNGSPPTHPVEQVYATVDRATMKASTTKRHLVANYGGGGGGGYSSTVATERDKFGHITSSTQLGKSLQAFPDSIV